MDVPRLPNLYLLYVSWIRTKNSVRLSYSVKLIYHQFSKFLIVTYSSRRQTAKSMLQCSSFARVVNAFKLRPVINLQTLLTCLCIILMVQVGRICLKGIRLEKVSLISIWLRQPACSILYCSFAENYKI